MNDLKEILKKENIKKYFINSLKFGLRVIVKIVLWILFFFLGIVEIFKTLSKFLFEKVIALIDLIIDNEKLQNLLIYKK